jgi:probable phosphoglycerate mutase
MERSSGDAPRLELWVVRHGQTVDNVKSFCQGHLDGQLTAAGVAQAQVLGRRLAETTFDRYYVSDLGRTRETFQAIASQWKLFDAASAPVVYSSLLREKAGGVAEGGPLSALHDAQKKSGLPIRDFKPQKGESWKDVYARAGQLLRQVFFECLVQRTGQGTPA